jgi:hypothetical protein
LPSKLDPALAELLLSAVGTIVAVVAFVAGEIRGRRSHQGKSPRWTVWPVGEWSLYRTTDQHDEPPEHPWLIRPTLTRLAFWNAGFDTIRSSDISQTAPFRIVGRRNVKLLDVKLVRTNGSGAGLRAEGADAGEWLIDFDYLRPEVGGLFVVFHSGTRPNDVAVVGELVEGNALERTAFPLFGLHGLFPRPVRRLIGDRWAHRFVVISELLTPIAVVRYLYPDILSAPERGVLGKLEILMFLGTVVAQTVISLVFLKGWRETVPDSLRPFDLSDDP